MKISRRKVPPNGWHFEVDSGVRLEAVNEEALTKQIFEYRLRHDIPVGDIERDLDDYYCGKWPEACHNEPVDDQPGTGPRSPSAEPLLNRVTRWASLLLSRLPRGGWTLVNNDEAARRGLICVGCPKNQPWRGGCAGCSQSTATVLAQLRQLRTSKQQGNLMGCGVCGWANDVAVFMPTEALELSEDQRAALPDRCWRKAM